MTPRTLAQAIPPKIRVTVYSVLAAMYGLELVWDVLEPGTETKVLASFTVLGFGLAALNASAATPPQG